MTDPAAATPEMQQNADEVGIKRMLAELAFPAGHSRQEFRDLEERFIEALDPLLRLFSSVQGAGNAELNRKINAWLTIE